MQWLAGRYDGYGIIEYPDGTIDLYYHDRRFACSCNSWSDAVNYMENDE